MDGIKSNKQLIRQAPYSAQVNKASQIGLRRSNSSPEIRDSSLLDQGSSSFQRVGSCPDFSTLQSYLPKESNFIRKPISITTQEATKKDFTLARLQEKDLQQAHCITKKLDWPHRLDDWMFHFRLAKGRAAFNQDGQLAGVGLWKPYGENFGSIGLIAVHPDFQRKGIGRKLMDEILREAGPRTLQLISTQSGKELYAKFGFMESSGIAQYQGIAKGQKVLPPSGVILAPLDQGNIEQVNRFDSDAFGADRKDVLEEILKTGAGVIAKNNQHILGFAMSRPFGRGRAIGPIVANDEMLATSLISHHLNEHPGFNRVDIMANSPVLASWLKDDVGFSWVDQAPIMIKGEPPRKNGTARVLSLVSQALN